MYLYIHHACRFLFINIIFGLENRVSHGPTENRCLLKNYFVHIYIYIYMTYDMKFDNLNFVMNPESFCILENSLYVALYCTKEFGSAFDVQLFT